MEEIRYSGNKTSYGVTQRENGRIEVRVYHDNASMRQVLRNATGNPRQLLQHYDAYVRSNIRAQNWLAQVMADYRSYFESNRVDIAL
jgi:hypothetical protein